MQGVRSESVNIAILGYGSIAQDHARAIVALGATTASRDLRLYAAMGPKDEPTAIDPGPRQAVAPG